MTQCPSCHVNVRYSGSDSGQLYTCSNCQNVHEYPRAFTPSPLGSGPLPQPGNGNAPITLSARSTWVIARGVLYGLLIWSLVMFLVRLVLPLPLFL